MNDKIKNILPKTGLICLLAGMLFSCNNQPIPKELEGKWKASGDESVVGERGENWWLEYTFQGTSYTLKGYPPADAQGDISFTGTRRDTILLVLSGTDRMATESHVVVLNPDSIELDGLIFKKVE